MKRLFLMMIVSVFGVSAFASGTSGSQSNAPTVDPFNATKTMKCVIVELKGPDMLLLEDPKTGEKQPYRLASKIRLKAKNKADFGGKKRLSFDDLAIGQEVKVTIAPARREVVSLKVIRLVDKENS